MFKEYHRRQDFLLPPSFSDLIDPGDLVNIVAEVVDGFDIRPFEHRYTCLGPNAYHPRMMLGLLFYAYSQGVFSSRKIAERVRYDVRFTFIAGYQTPDFRTISDFRKNHIDLVKQYFIKIVRLCRQVGLLPLRMVAIDGTKIKANASSDKLRQRDALAKELKAVEEEMARVLALAQVTDDRESGDPETPDGTVQFDDGLPVGNLQQLRDKLRQAQAQLDAAPDRDNINLTDPDCRIMRGIGSGYNAQLAVDAENGIIVGADVVVEASDAHQLTPMVDQVDLNTASRGESKIALADAGYSSSTAYTELEVRPHIDAYVPLQQDVHRERVRQEAPPFDKSRFSLNPVTGCGTCPLGQPMRAVRRSVNKRGRRYIAFLGTACPDCARRLECTRAEYRHVELLLANPALERMRAKMKTATGRRAMAMRRQTVEPVIGILKEQLGFRRFKLRGLQKVKGEFALLCAAFDLKKLQRLLGGIPVAQALSALNLVLKPINVLFLRLVAFFQSARAYFSFLQPSQIW
jgi:transposase